MYLVFGCPYNDCAIQLLVWFTWPDIVVVPLCVCSCLELALWWTVLGTDTTSSPLSAASQEGSQSGQNAIQVGTYVPYNIGIGQGAYSNYILNFAEPPKMLCVHTILQCLIFIYTPLADPLHTYLGLCGLSLNGEKGVCPIHAALNISQRAADWLKTLQTNT